ncbi:hypothetical protein EMCRGX_G010755 [Ephydatia muelleri]
MLLEVAILLNCLSAVKGTTFNVTLAQNDLARYDHNNPMLVNISDTIRFSCSGSVSNVIILASLQQWQSCDATTGGPPFLWAYCLTNTSIKTVTIIHQSNSVAGTFSFDEGQDYYLASFSDGTLNGAVHTAYSGGECSSGVKMVIRVRATSFAATSSAAILPVNIDATSATSLQNASSISATTSTARVLHDLGAHNWMHTTMSSVMMVLCAVLVTTLV